MPPEIIVTTTLDHRANMHELEKPPIGGLSLVMTKAFRRAKLRRMPHDVVDSLATSIFFFNPVDSVSNFSLIRWHLISLIGRMVL